MSISYPITLPSGLSSVEPIGESFAGIAVSPFTAQQQIQEWAGQFWRMKCAYPPMQRAKAELVISALLSLRGIVGTFFLGDPLGKTPQSTAGGSPIVNGAGQAGKQLAISGLTGVLKAGDYFHIGSAGENLFLFSQAFENAIWVYTQMARPTADTIVAPDGTTTAEALIPSAATDARCNQSVLATPGTSYTFSVWLKVPSGTKNIQIIIDPNGSIGQVNNPITVTTTWTRFSVTIGPSGWTPYADGLHLLIGGNATWTTGEIDAWGAQLERGSVVNNYVPTTANQSGPTRQLLKNLVDAGPGSVTLDIFPRLRTSLLNADPLILTNSVGLFRLASNSTPWTVDKAKFYGIAFEAVEAL